MDTINQPFELSDLALPSVMIFLVVFVLSLMALRRVDFALAISVIKMGIFLVYFGWFYDGSFTYLDDWSYLFGGQFLRDQGINYFNIIESQDVLVSVAEGRHFLYYILNKSAIDFFGFGYYAPVAINVMISAFIAYVGMRLALMEGFVNSLNARLFFSFLILHPNITAWSSIVNGKDILVLFLHVLLLFSISLFMRGDRLKSLTIGGVSIFVLLYLRFYIPLFFFAVVAIGFILYSRWSIRLLVFMIALLIFPGLFVLIGSASIFGAFENLSNNLVNPVYGFLRFMLSPIPFNSDLDFAFLNFPAYLHWLMFPMMLMGFVKLSKMNTMFSRILIIYLILFSLLYSFYGELQGPRHRLQLDYVIALLQFIGIVHFLRYARSDPADSTRCRPT
jgi:hypothetical protein